MIGTIHDVLLALVNGGDTVNEWRNKTNAIIDFINKTPFENIPAVVFGTEPPNDTTFNLWWNTSESVLYTYDGAEWIPFHQMYAYEMKFYKKTINNDKVIPSGYNALAVSPTIANGVTVTVEPGSTLRIV